MYIYPVHNLEKHYGQLLKGQMQYRHAFFMSVCYCLFLNKCTCLTRWGCLL